MTLTAREMNVISHTNRDAQIAERIATLTAAIQDIANKGQFVLQAYARYNIDLFMCINDKDVAQHFEDLGFVVSETREVGMFFDISGTVSWADADIMDIANVSS